jgi:tetratricopeptide (TPR) repeat protein
MGTLFALLSRYAGLSQTRIGTAVGLGQGRTSEIINGIRAVAATHVFQRIADGLDMPDPARILLGISPRHVPAEPRPVSIKRGTGTDLLRQITAASGVDTTVIRALQNETDTIRLLDRRLGAPAVAGKLEAHITHIETCLRYSLRPGNREKLAVVLADASALAGWQAIDMGHLPRAWEHFERATAAAREAHDPSLLGFADGEQAYVLLDLHKPADALAMVRTAYEQTHADIPHQLRGWLRAAEAEMAAATGQESTCRTALDGATQEISHGTSGDDLPYPALNETHLAHWRGNSLVMFGDPATADELSTALAQMDGEFTRAEAGLSCALAAALHVRGEKDQARLHLKRARELAQVHRLRPPAPHRRPRPPTHQGRLTYRIISNRINAASESEFQIAPDAISSGTWASGTHSMRSTSFASVGSASFSGCRPTNTTYSESTMPTIGWNVISCFTLLAGSRSPVLAHA